ncbi:MAG: iron complex outermembrane receptor protein [Oleiphilaceae bacterium]
MKFKLYTIYILLVLAVTAFAEEPLRHQEVIITANPVAADEIDTDFQTGHVTVIHRDEFEGELSSVADVLKKQTGVQIRRIGGVGSYSTVNIRGASGAQVNVYLDGILLNGAYGGAVDLSQFLLGSVESIEIYRGNVPVQLGSSSIGGAINIKSLTSAKNDSKQISTGYGSFDTKRLSGTIIEREVSYDALFSGEYLSSDNDYELINENGTYQNSTDDTKEKRNNADFEHFSGMFSGEYRVSDSLSLQALVQGYSKEQGLSELQNNPLTRSQIDTEFLTGQLKVNFWSSSQASYVFKFFSSQKSERYRDLQSRIGVRANNEKGITTNVGVGFQASKDFYSHLLSLNIESKSESYSLDDFSENQVSEYNRVNSLLGLQDDWVDQSGRFMLTLGAKGQYIDDDNGKLGNENTNFYSSFFSGYRYQVNNNLLLQANLAREVRVPSLEEKFGDRGYTKGTEELKPETAINSDIGFNYNNSFYRAGLTYFYRRIDDAIITIFDSQGTGKPKNISKSNIHGLELETSFSISDNWIVVLSSTFQRSKDLSSSSSSASKLLPGLYEREAFFSTSYRHMSFEYTVEYEYQSGGFYDSSNTESAQLPTTTQINFVVSWKQNDHHIEFMIDNANDQIIQDFHRYPSPGRTLSASYTYNF